MAQFNGQQFIRPTVAVRTDDSRIVGTSDASTITLAVIGVARGGEPGKSLVFNSAREARQVLRSGPLLDAVERAYGPGASTAGARRAVAVRLNPATRSTVTLDDASAADALVLTSTDYGVHTAQIGIEITAASINVPTPVFPTVVKLAVTKPSDAGQPPIGVVKDNLGRRGIKLRYTGAGSAATLTATPAAVPPLLTSTVTGGAGFESFSIDLSVFNTLEKLVDKINQIGGWAAAIDAGANPSAPATTLDGVTAANGKPTTDPDTVAGPFFAHLRCDLQEQVDFINQQLGGFLTAARATGATRPAAVVAKTYLSGGAEVDGSLTTTHWQTAFDVLQSEDVQVVVPVTDDAAVHAMAAAHCLSMSGADAKRERIAIVGGASGETITQVKARAANLNSDRVQVVWPGLVDNAVDQSGTLTTIPPYLVAAQKAGITAGLPIASSATNLAIGAKAVERVLTPGQIEELVAGGVCVVEMRPQKGFYIVQDITTWLGDTKFTRRELSTRMALDYVVRTLRAALEPRIGQTNGPAFAEVIRSDVGATLRKLADRRVLVGGPSNPAWTALTVDVQGDQVNVSVQVSIAVPANYIFLTIFPTVFSTPLPASS